MHRAPTPIMTRPTRWKRLRSVSYTHLDVPTEGTYLLDGKDVGKMSRRELAHIRNEKLGFIFQQYSSSFSICMVHIYLPRSIHPVSYTHLDVYKRQGRKADFGMFLKNCITVVTINKGVIPNDQRREQLALLDVYKRQGWMRLFY